MTPDTLPSEASTTCRPLTFHYTAACRVADRRCYRLASTEYVYAAASVLAGTNALLATTADRRPLRPAMAPLAVPACAAGTRGTACGLSPANSSTCSSQRCGSLLPVSTQPSLCRPRASPSKLSA